MRFTVVIGTVIAPLDQLYIVFHGFSGVLILNLEFLILWIDLFTPHVCSRAIRIFGWLFQGLPGTLPMNILNARDGYLGRYRTHHGYRLMNSGQCRRYIGCYRNIVETRNRDILRYGQSGTSKSRHGSYSHEVIGREYGGELKTVIQSLTGNAVTTGFAQISSQYEFASGFNACITKGILVAKVSLCREVETFWPINIEYISVSG